MFWQSMLLGLVEGITEFLPISSTAHLLMVEHSLNLHSDFVKSFTIVIQLGAILAVIVLYWRSFLVQRDILFRVAVACVPTGILGLILYKLVKEVFLEDLDIVLGSLALGGLGLILFEWLHGERENSIDALENISWSQALIMGVCQVFAMVPGVSRAAATAVGGMIVGIRRKTVIEFSFLLAVPTMIGATGLELYKTGASYSTSEIQFLAIGFCTSFVVAIFAIKLLLQFLANHSFVVFGVYRILAAALFWWILM